MIVVVSILYLLGSVGLWRIARYSCVGLSWLSFIPLVNLIYLCVVADRLNVESLECDWSIHGYIIAAALILSLIGYLLQKYLTTDTAIIAGRIMLLTGIAASFIDLMLAYYSIVDKALPWFWLMWFMSAPVGFTPLLFVGSFVLPKRIEAELEDLYDYDVDNG